MRIRMIGFVVLLMFLSNSGYANTINQEFQQVENVFSKKNILGWKSVKFGTTYSQISRLYELTDWEKDVTPSPRCFLKNNINLCGIEFKVGFWFDKKSSIAKLHRITLGAQGKPNKNIYDRFYNNILKENGEPFLTKNSGFYDDQSFWFHESDQLIVQSGTVDNYYFVIIENKPYIESKDFVFRKTKWGMSKKEVLASEKESPVFNKENLIVFKSKILEKSVNIAYIFIKNKLVRAKYILNEEHTNKNDYIIDYMDFKKILKKKYNYPYNELNSIFWRNELYKKDLSKYGFAISLGHLVYHSKWDTDSSIINTILYGENFDIKLIVEYSSKQYMYLEREKKEQQALDNF